MPAIEPAIEPAIGPGSWKASRPGGGACHRCWPFLAAPAMR